jgi:hypothetical protein
LLRIRNAAGQSIPERDRAACLTVSACLASVGYINTLADHYMFFRVPLRAAVLSVALLLLAACAGAPVQQMSDARQAISAAQAAGAADLAPAQLNDAQTTLKSAEAYLARQEFREAREAAERARRIAGEALLAAEAARRAQKP